MTDPEKRATGHRSLLKHLDERGLLDDPWRRVWDAVPRDLFIPPRIWRQRSTRCEPVRTDAAWWELVHSDEPVVIQVDDGQEDGPGVATSSNSMPSMVARMLGLLQVEDGHRVLEIGTASGFVAALLSERLGEERVFSVELDPGLVERGRHNLAAAGYAPTVVQADGEKGWPAAAPYDRIIATCALRRVPFALVGQLRPGGVLVAPLVREFGSGALVQLTVQPDGTAVGPFRGGASYMPMRSHRAQAGAPIDESTGRCTSTGLDPAHAVTLPFTLYAGARIPGLSMVSHREDDGVRVWLDDGQGSGATLGSGEPVWLYGPRDLWTEVERVHAEFRDLGSPGTEEFGLTVTPDGQGVWLHTPATVVEPLRLHP
ncbi:methyltransferase domain-containing protein [Streptomyces sp. NPDC047108]|uniref:methyltransferase domain-containing protein n=1 Tax=Streptomyces sp. NPDC047108 TaxID=3155025 RepID=UPI0033DACE68